MHSSQLYTTISVPSRYTDTPIIICYFFQIYKHSTIKVHRFSSSGSRLKSSFVCSAYTANSDPI